MKIKKNKDFNISIICNLIEGLLSGFNFLILLKVIELLFTESTTYKQILELTVFVIAIFIIRILIYSYGYTLGQIGGASISKNIRIALGNKFKEIPLSKFSENTTGTFVNGAFTDVNNYEKVLTHKVGVIFKNSMLSIMIIAFIMSFNITCGLIAFIVFLLLIPSLFISTKAVNHFGNKKNKIINENTTNLVEYIDGLQTLRAYNIAGINNEKIIKSLTLFKKISILYESAVIPIGSIYMIMGWLTLPLFIYFGTISYLNGNLLIQNYVLLSMLPLFYAKLLSSIFINFTAIRNLLISKNNISKIFEIDSESSNNQELKVLDNSISFENVCFEYEKDNEVLKDLSFEAKKNQFTAIVGDSGCGKSTILNLICKYYETKSGTIKIGNKDIKNFPSTEVLKQISIVNQDVFLFNDTIKNNIGYAKKDASYEEIERAAEKANCIEFINNLKEGLNSEVGENGNKLSGGERQRIAIARAILKDSPIILLDEATSALDIENELLVKQAIQKLLRNNKTVIMVAHNLSIIEKADKIIVIDNGKIKEQGSHEQLIRNRGKYFEMYSAEKAL